MKPDDEEFKRRIETIVERGKKIDELRVTTIKGHLILEEALDAFIDASLFYPEQLDSVTFNFHQKGHLALSLSLGLEKTNFGRCFGRSTSCETRSRTSSIQKRLRKR